MTQKEMFERSFQRPRNYFDLSAKRQWEIDAELGILDMDSQEWSAEEKARYQAHYSQ